MAMGQLGDSAEFLAHRPGWAVVPFPASGNAGGRDVGSRGERIPGGFYVFGPKACGPVGSWQENSRVDGSDALERVTFRNLGHSSEQTGGRAARYRFFCLVASVFSWN